MKEKDLIEWDKLQKEEEKEDIILEKIRKSGKKVKVTSEEYFDHFDPTFCRYCMNCNDEDGGCNAGITIEQWHEMHINGIECEKYDYIYETDDEN